MRNYVAAFLVLCGSASIVWVAMAVVSIVVANPVAKQNDLPDIIAKSLTIKGGDGKGSISMTVTDKGPGLWLTNPNGDHICITALNDGANHAVWLYRGNQKEPASANIAIGMDSKGAVVVQFRDSKQNIRFLSLEKLADMPLDKLLEGVK